MRPLNILDAPPSLCAAMAGALAFIVPDKVTTGLVALAQAIIVGLIHLALRRLKTAMSNAPRRRNRSKRRAKRPTGTATAKKQLPDHKEQ